MISSNSCVAFKGKRNLSIKCIHTFHWLLSEFIQLMLIHLSWNILVYRWKQMIQYYFFLVTKWYAMHWKISYP